MTTSERDHAVDGLIDLVAAIDSVVQSQVNNDVNYFIDIGDLDFTVDEIGRIEKTVLAAYRWQYILSGVEHPRFSKILSAMITQTQADRIQSALGAVLQ